MVPPTINHVGLEVGGIVGPRPGVVWGLQWGWHPMGGHRRRGCVVVGQWGAVTGVVHRVLVDHGVVLLDVLTIRWRQTDGHGQHQSHSH